MKLNFARSLINLVDIRYSIFNIQIEFLKITNEKYLIILDDSSKKLLTIQNSQNNFIFIRYLIGWQWFRCKCCENKWYFLHLFRRALQCSVDLPLGTPFIASSWITICFSWTSSSMAQSTVMKATSMNYFAVPCFSCIMLYVCGVELHFKQTKP